MKLRCWPGWHDSTKLIYGASHIHINAYLISSRLYEKLLRIAFRFRPAWCLRRLKLTSVMICKKLPLLKGFQRQQHSFISLTKFKTICQWCTTDFSIKFHFPADIRFHSVKCWCVKSESSLRILIQWDLSYMYVDSQSNLLARNPIILLLIFMQERICKLPAKMERSFARLGSLDEALSSRFSTFAVTLKLCCPSHFAGQLSYMYVFSWMIILSGTWPSRFSQASIRRWNPTS